MNLDTSLREFISPFDYIGLVRCIAVFEGMDRPDVILDLDSTCLAAVWNDRKEGLRVSGTITRMFYYGPLQLLHAAAHEIGHVAVGHLKQHFRRFISLFSTKQYNAREKEADDWAEKYAYNEGWRTAYREWDFF